MPKPPPAAPRLALAGRVVCMDDKFQVLPKGVVYVEGGQITAVQDAARPAPAGFLAAVETGGTIYPGLIELHNHLSYDALRLWDVPKKFTNRDQWQGSADYHRLVSGPMQVLAGLPDGLPAVV